MRRISHWVSKMLKRHQAINNIILIGIDYPSFSLGKAILENNRNTHITAFIDEEPWANKTQIHGVTVYYPSDLMTLIAKHHVRLVVYIKGQQPELQPALQDEIKASNTTLLALEQNTPIQSQLTIINQALSTSYLN